MSTLVQLGMAATGACGVWMIISYMRYNYTPPFKREDVTAYVGFFHGWDEGFDIVQEADGWAHSSTPVFPMSSRQREWQYDHSREAISFYRPIWSL